RHHRQIGTGPPCRPVAALIPHAPRTRPARCSPERAPGERRVRRLGGGAGWDAQEAVILTATQRHSGTAADFTGGLVAALVAQVASAVTDPRSMEPDEYYGEVVPAIVEIVGTRHELPGTASIPRPEVVAEWKARFMEVWETHVDGLSPSPQ